MQRITQKDLEAAVSRLNTMTGNAQAPYTQDSTGKLKANIGNYYLDGAYGGWRLVQVMSDGGGVRNVTNSGYAPKRECYNSIHAYINGIADCIRGEAEHDKIINNLVKRSN